MKYALVTGGSRGIGKAVALKLANQGWPVLINYRSNQEAAQATLDEIVAAGGQAELLPFDVASAEQTEKAIDQW
jgi:3-oxoacyl-[acyl-carrier protein] reductase